MGISSCKKLLSACNLTSFQKKVLLAVCKIPKGSVATYKQVAKAIGVENSFRAVGNALASNPFPVIIPCHRVVNSNCSIGNYQKGRKMKRKFLLAEGVEITTGKISKAKPYKI